MLGFFRRGPRFLLFLLCEGLVSFGGGMLSRRLGSTDCDF